MNINIYLSNKSIRNEKFCISYGFNLILFYSIKLNLLKINLFFIIIRGGYQLISYQNYN